MEEAGLNTQVQVIPWYEECQWISLSLSKENVHISTTGHPMTTLESMNICDGSSISFDIIAANVGESTNEKSIVLKVKNVQRSVLLSGNVEGNIAKIIAETVAGQLKATVYQISHHGAATYSN